MNHRRRTFSSLALLTILAAAPVWYRFTPGDAPPGQPALVTLDTTSLPTLRADFNRDVKPGATHRPSVSNLRNLSAGGLRSRIESPAARERSHPRVCSLAADATDRLVGAGQLGSESAFGSASAAMLGSESCPRDPDEERRACSPYTNAASDRASSGTWRHFTGRAPYGPIGCRQQRSSTGRWLT